MRALIFSIALLALLAGGSAYGQCKTCTTPFSGTAFADPASDASWTAVAADIDTGEYLLFDVVAGTYYEWSTCDSVSPAFNTELTLIKDPGSAYTCTYTPVDALNGTMNGSVVAFNSYVGDCSSGGINLARVGWYADFTGTVALLLTRPYCQTTNASPSNIVVNWHKLTTPPEHCTNCAQQKPATTQSNPVEKPNWTTVGTNFSGGDFALFTVAKGTYYEWTTCAGNTFDTQLTLRRNNCQGEPLAYNNDYTSDPTCGTRSRIGWFADFSGTVSVLVSQFHCTTNTQDNMRLDWRKFPVTDQCSNCTDDPVGLPFNANTNTDMTLYPGQFVTFRYVTGGATYEFSTCGATIDTQITLRGAPGVTAPDCTAALIAYNDNGDGEDTDGNTCGEGSKIIWTAPSGFTGGDGDRILIAMNRFNCQDNTADSVQLRFRKLKDTRYTEMVPDPVNPTEVVINDNTTNLFWTKDIKDAVEIADWVSALSYCSSLSYAGFDDWRLPDINELTSIVDFSLQNPSTAMPAITTEEWFWAGDTYLGSTDPADRRFVWVANLQDGRNYMDAKADFGGSPAINRRYAPNTLCVRDSGLIGIHFNFTKNDYDQNEQPMSVAGWTCDKSFYSQTANLNQPLPALWVYFTVTDHSGVPIGETELFRANRKLTPDSTSNCGPNGATGGYDFSFDMNDPANVFEGETDNVRTVIRDHIIANMQNPANPGDPTNALQPLTVAVYALPLNPATLVPSLNKTDGVLLYSSPKMVSMFFDSTAFCGDGYLQSGETCDPVRACAHSSADYHPVCAGVFDVFCETDCTGAFGNCDWHCCGDGVIDGAFGEICESDANCQTINPDYYNTDIAACSADCTAYNTGDCKWCGDGLVTNGEGCDNATLNCNVVPHTPAYYNTDDASCRNIATPGDCTGYDLSNCKYCGDGLVTNGESCDGGVDCSTIVHNPAYYAGDTAGCNASCSAQDNSQCKWCGDGIVSNGEACDGDTKNCGDLAHFPGYYSTESAACFSDCSGYDVSACRFCGDTALTNGETCDNNAVGCETLPHTPAYYNADDADCLNLSDPGNCSGFNPSNCKYCGDTFITAGNEVITAGLVLNLPMDDAGGTAVDASGNGNDGALVNGATWGAGKYGGAVALDGVNDYVRINDAASLDLTTGFTAEMWLYNTIPFGAASTKYIFGKGNTTSYAAYWDTGTGYVNFRLRISGTTRTLQSSKKRMGVNVWQHWVFTYDGTNMKIYVDGELDTIVAYPGAIQTNALDLHIGRDNASANYFKGNIDQFRIYDRPLTQDEIKANMGEYCDSDTRNCQAIDPKYYNTDSATCDAFCSDFQGTNLAASGGRDWTNIAQWTVGGSPAGDLEWDPVQNALKATGYVTARLAITNRIPIDTARLYYLRYDVMMQNPHAPVQTFYAGTMNYTVSSGGTNLRTDYFGHNGYTIPTADVWYTDRINEYIYKAPKTGTSFNPSILIRWPEGTQYAEIYFLFNRNVAANTQVTYLRNLKFYELPCKWCGDGIQNGPEACDSGSSTTEYCHTRTHSPAYYDDGMTSTCDINCTASTETNCNFCGDGAVTDYPRRDITLLMHFDENYGATAYDWSGNNYNGTITGATWTTGKFGTRALNFAAAAHKVQLNNPLLPGTTGAFTISAWIYPTSATDSTIAGNYSPTTNANGVQFYKTAGNNIALRVGGVTVTSAGTVTLNAWNYVTVVRAGTAANTTRLYINGVQNSTGTIAAAATAGANFAIGNGPDFATMPFVGKIDEVQVFLRDITTTYIQNKALHLPFDEQTGATAYDWSGNDLDGTITEATRVAGKKHTALLFDGVDDKVVIPSMTVLPAGTGAFTLSAWIYPTASGTNDYIVGNYSSSTNLNGIQFYLNTANRLVIRLGGNSLTGTAVLPLNTWSHVAVTKSTATSGTNTYIYINGLQDKSGGLAAGSLAVLANWAVGSGPDYDTDAFVGRIDDVRVEARALSSAEIRMAAKVNEVCDTAGPAATLNCKSVNPIFYDTITIPCNVGCESYGDTSACKYCGNNTVDSRGASETPALPAVEACDPPMTCAHDPADYFFAGPTVADRYCANDCTAGYACVWRFCGDNVTDGADGEACDGDPGGGGCESMWHFPPYYAGNGDNCKSDCSGWTSSGCDYCGNDKLEAPYIRGGNTYYEQCDGDNKTYCFEIPPAYQPHFPNTYYDNGAKIVNCKMPSWPTFTPGVHCMIEPGGDSDCRRCGDGIFTAAYETCDTVGATATVNCTTRGHLPAYHNTGDTASCNAGCQTDYNEANCKWCGDGLYTNTHEACDTVGATALKDCALLAHMPAYYGGDSASCQSTCLGYDESVCKWCGDGAQSNGENCDTAKAGGTLGSATIDCQTYNVSWYTGYTATCNAGCFTGYDVSNCKYCGDSSVTDGESCDTAGATAIVNCDTRPHVPAYYNTQNATCKAGCFTGYDETACKWCGDASVTNGEACDTAGATATKNCSLIGHVPAYHNTGDVGTCNSACGGYDQANCKYCGDSIYTNPQENCDTAKAGGTYGSATIDCQTYNASYYTGSSATCNANCNAGYNTSACRWCGDGVYSSGAPFNESCDTALVGAAYGSATIACPTYNASYYPGANATCNTGCKGGYNINNCRWCGDALVTNGEACDTSGGTATVACNSVPHSPAYYNTTSATCNAGCMSYTEAACKFCGDTLITDGETCDGGTRNCGLIAHTPAYYNTETAECRNRMKVWYRFDAGAGATLADSSANGINGAITGATWTTNGKFGKALSFDGSGDYVQIPGSAHLDLQSLTISQWNYAATYDANMFMFEKTTNGAVNTQYSLFFDGGGTNHRIIFRTVGLTPQDLIIADHASGPVANQWNHIVATYDAIAKVKKIYVNGVEIASQSGITGAIPTNPAGTSWIGAYGGGAGYPFNGRIDETRVYPRPLTAAEAANDTATCSGYDESVCKFCGDGAVSAPNGEVCDTVGSTATVDCSLRSHSPSYYGGDNATCNGTCGSYNEAACKWCGDGAVQSAKGEVCDGNTVNCSTLVHSPAYYNITNAQCSNIATPGVCTGMNESNCLYCGDGTLSNSVATVVSGTLRHYKFNETAGTTAADSSGNGVNATLVNGPAWNAGGKFARGLSLDGVNDYASFSTAGISNNAGTIEYWVRPQGWNGADGSYHGGFQTVAPGSWGNQAGQITIINQWANTFYFRYNPDGPCCTLDVTFSTAGVFANGQWTHIAVTWNKATNTLAAYVNGVLKASRSDWAAPIATPIGATGYIGVGHDRYTAGLMDEFKLYNRALTAGEIMEKALELHLDEGTGTKAYDASGNNSNGTLVNGTLWTTSGKYRKAASFDGTDDHITVPDAANLNPTSITVMMWLYLTANPDCDGNNNWRALLYKGSTAGTATGYDIVMEQNGAIVWDTGSASPHRHSTGITIPLNTWTHLALSYNESGTKKAYLNGAPVSTVAVTAGPLLSNTNALYISNPSTACPNGAGAFPGRIDEVKIFKRALSDAEVSSHATQTVDAYEDCDNGGSNSDAMCAYNAAFSDCTRCRTSCQGSFQGAQWCGDDIVNGGEACDDGAANTGTPCVWQVDPYTCASCSLSCTSGTAQYCGDNVTQGAYEACDKHASSADRTKLCQTINASYYPTGAVGTCNASCAGYDIGSCKRCGDGTISTMATTSNLVLRMPMDEGSGGVAYDKSGWGNNGTIVNPYWTTSVPNAKYLYSLYFDSSARYVQVADNANLRLNAAWTIEAWVAYGSTGRMLILGKGGPKNQNYGLWVEDGTTGTAGHLMCHFDFDDLNVGAGVHTANSYANWGWHYVVCTYNKTTQQLTLHVNGGSLAGGETVTRTYNQTPDQTTEPLYIGGYSPMGYANYTGYVDEVRIFNGTDLTAQNVKDNWDLRSYHESCDEGASNGCGTCTTSCTPKAANVCGDGVACGAEQCDGGDFKGATCASLTGHTQGSLSCAGCNISTAGCYTCGNGSVEGPEACDGANLGGNSCATRPATGPQTVTFNYTGGMQSWTAPSTGTYTIDTYGAQGGTSTYYGFAGGLGARMKGDFSLTAGTELKILVGGQGGTGSYAGGGGGGSFVTNTGNSPYIIAGGGGGASMTQGCSSTYLNRKHAVTGTSGVTGWDEYNCNDGGAGGAANNGGGYDSSYGQPMGSGGGGQTGHGGSYQGAAYAGYSFTEGGGGGALYGSYTGAGGYGGGGGAGYYSGWCGGGGGGGYGGGGGGSGDYDYCGGGGGGGSYNGGSNQTNTGGTRSGNGLVTITYTPNFAGGTLSCNAGCGSFNTSQCYLCGDGNITAWSGEVCDAGAGNYNTAEPGPWDGGAMSGWDTGPGPLGTGSHTYRRTTCNTECSKYAPHGAIDAFNLYALTGWACDYDKPSNQAQAYVHVLGSGGQQVSHFYYFYNVASEPAVGAACEDGSGTGHRVNINPSTVNYAMRWTGATWGPATSNFLSDLQYYKSLRPFQYQIRVLDYPNPWNYDRPLNGWTSFGGSCGDGAVQGEFESCDSGTNHCKRDCSGVGSCGDGNVDFQEVCDGANFNGATCATMLGAGYSGSLSCSSCTSISTAGCYKECTHWISLYDTYGDGWNGARMDLYVNGVKVLNQIYVSSGSGPTNYSYTVRQGQTVLKDFTANGTYPGECYYTNNYNNSGSPGTVFYTAPTGVADHSYSANCP